MERIQSEHIETTTAEEMNASSSAESKLSVTDSLFRDFMERANAKRRASGPQQGLSVGFQAESIIAAYFSDLPYTKTNDVLKFWWCNSAKYGKLAEIALGFLTIPASTATIERVFSIAGDIADVKRNRICPKMLEIETMLRFNKMLIE